MRAIECARFGGPEVLNLVHVSEPVAVDGQLLVDVSAAGVNFADTSRIAGSYRPAPELPFIPGTEVVGRTADGRRVLRPSSAVADLPNGPSSRPRMPWRCPTGLATARRSRFSCRD